MTDKEMAEEYANKNVPTGAFGYRSLDDVHYDVAQAYLAGLKAGKPQWHKVADGDLPKNEKDVLVYSGEDWRMCVGRYSPKNKAWEAGCDTVAWCEIPEYKGE